MLFSKSRCITALFLLMLPAAVQAQFNYITNDGTITITGYTGPGGAVVIPAETNGYPVTDISDYAFYLSSVTKVSIPGSVTSIGNYAFSDCFSLTSVTMGNNVTSIGLEAFFQCVKLTDVAIPNSVVSIGYQAFTYCSQLTNIIIPDSVTNIGSFAFRSCSSLTDEIIPDSVISIGSGPFADCTSLTNITVCTSNPAYSSANGILFDKTQATIIQYPNGLTNDCYTIPNDVTNIGDSAFYGSSLTMVVIPNSVETIGAGAFDLCLNLTSVALSSGLTTIGEDAFYECNSLTNIIIPASVTTIGDHAFAYSFGPVSAYFEGNAPPDDGTVFYDDPTTVYYLPGTTGWGATFGGVPAVEETTPDDEFIWVTNNDDLSITLMGYTGSNDVVVIPDTINGYAVASIGMNAFVENTSLTSVTIPNSVTNIGDEAFNACTNLTSVILPDSIITIGSESFGGCISLASITIPNSVTTIGAGGFDSCTRLNSITIPNSVANIGPFTFENCVSMTNISVNADNPDYSSLNGVLFDKVQDALLAYPSGLTNSAYTIPNSVTTVQEDAIVACANLAGIIIPGSVTNIIGTFIDCTGLTNIWVNPTNPAYSSLAGVLFDKAQDTLLQYPQGLANTTYSIPNSVTTIQGYAFSLCSHLVSITIPNSVTSIGWGEFLQCTSLASVAIPNGVTNIPNYAFYYCGSLTNVVIPDSVTSIGLQAFLGCSSLTNIIIPASVTSIEDMAFSDCGNLTSAYFQGNAPAGGGGAFDEDPATVYYLPGTTGWGTTYGNVPTQLWFQPQPTVLTFEPSFGVQNNQFGFTISWATNATIVVQACTNLSNPVWIPVATNALTSGTNFFTDPSWANYSSRYYRISAQ